MEKPYEKLIRYCKINTMSSDTEPKSPTTARQFDLARLLKTELEQIGLRDVFLGEDCIVYGKLPASPGFEQVPAVGFLSHVDTVPDFTGENVQPLVHEHYDGKDIVLPKCDRVISLRDFPYLQSKVGKTIVTASGDTLLGADDKAGIAEILCLCEKLIEERIPHGPVCVAFTPDEEVGLGTDNFDLKRFGADFAYTLDGGEVGEVVYENFNAGSAVLTFRGVNVHPGSAKGIMVNASLVAMEANAMLPNCETPAQTEDHEGFYHLMSMEGNVEHAKLSYIVRDHDAAKLEYRREMLEHIVKAMNEKYAPNTVSLEWKYGYRNMKDKVQNRLSVVEAAIRATEAVGVKPLIRPIRGGTDGAALTERGLICPNLGMGASGFHGPYEHAIAEDMELCVSILAGIVREVAKGNV